MSHTYLSGTKIFSGSITTASFLVIVKLKCVKNMKEMLIFIMQDLGDFLENFTLFNLGFRLLNKH